MIAPIGRVMSARPTVSAMSGRDFPNAVATSWMTNVRTKKSKASSVHPRNPARTALRWFARSAAFMVRRRILRRAGECRRLDWLLQRQLHRTKFAAEGIEHEPKALYRRGAKQCIL